ncbi:MAG: carboxylesterase family protein, partial [Sphingobium sp.]
MKVGRREFFAGISAPLILGAAGMARARTPQDATGPVLARTRFGPVIGQPDQGSLAFKGIPYGGPTSGKSRFMAPSPPQPWDNPLRAFAYGPISPQSDPAAPKNSSGSKSTESEDCLTLNVWTPALRDNGKRPVMVWLHGGGLWRLSAAGDYQAGARLAAN